MRAASPRPTPLGRVGLLVALLFAAPAATALASPASDPLLASARTYGVIAGVLSWADPGVQPFSAELRKDQELHDLLLARGVPRDQLSLLLDRRATAAAVFAEVDRLAALAPAGSTFLFYYAGHGSRDAAGRPYFLAHDASRDGQGRLWIHELETRLRRHFKGLRLVLMADCCYSGTLKEIAARLAAPTGGRRLETLALTSADASNLSTSNWTFTQTVIDGLRGDAQADANGDGVVTLAELATEVARAMKFREGQRSGFFVHGLGSGTSLSRSATPRPAGTGDYVRAPAASGQLKVARVVARRAGQSLVRFYDYNRGVDRWVDSAILQPVRFARHGVGASLAVLWGGRTWPARVLRTEGDFHLITYPGWPAYWDEWVLSNRIVGDPTALRAPASMGETTAQ